MSAQMHSISSVPLWAVQILACLIVPFSLHTGSPMFYVSCPNSYALSLGVKGPIVYTAVLS